MYRPNYKKILKYTTLVAYIFFIYVLQSMVFTHIEILGIKPLLLPIAVVVIALFEGCTCGGIMGLIGGIFCDLSFNQPTIEFTLVLTAVGLLTGYLCERILERGISSCVFCSVITLVLSAFVQMFSLLIYQNVPLFHLLETALIQTVYSLIFVIPIYYLYRLIMRKHF